MARANTTGSFSWKPIAISCIDSSTTGLSRPTAPKSRNQRHPPPSTKMFPGCGSAWQYAVAQHLVEERVQQTPRQHVRRFGRGTDRGLVGDGHAGDLLHHQHAGVDSDWYTTGVGDVVVVGDVLEEHDPVRGFGAVVELLLERGDEPFHPELARRLDPTVDHTRRHPEHRIAVDDVFDAGTLDLHDDVLTASATPLGASDRSTQARGSKSNEANSSSTDAELAETRHGVGVDRTLTIAAARAPS